MPRGYPSLTSEQKQDVIARVKEKGERVPDLAKEYGVVPKTIYHLLSRLAMEPHGFTAVVPVFTPLRQGLRGVRLQQMTATVPRDIGKRGVWAALRGEIVMRCHNVPPLG